MDVGTNTVRLLVADVDSLGRIVPVDTCREMPRLGEGLVHTGRLSEGAMERSVKVLVDYAQRIRQAAPEGFVAAATSAVREAENGPDFVERVRRDTGLPLEVIGGDEEARLTALGAAAVVAGDVGELLIVDIGGGSTEFILIRNGETHRRVSVPMGVVTLTERFFRSDPPSASDLYDLDEYVRGQMREVRRGLGELGPVRLVATAGTPTTLAAIDLEMAHYEPERINNHVLSLARVEELFDLIVAVPVVERRRITGIEPGREELMVAGTAVLLRVMHDYQFGAVVVSDWGLREGLILDLFRHLDL